MRESFSLALKSILSNKLRSFLTMLGIIIGVASVIILVSLITGYMSYMTESFADMGTNQINVSVRNMSTRYVTDTDMYEYYNDNKDVFCQMSPSVSIGLQAKAGDTTLSYASITGVGEEYADMKGYKMCAGRSISYSDIQARLKVAVIGYYDACELYGNAAGAVGEKIKIGGNPYTIIGVVERQSEDDLEEGGSDDFILIPYTAALKMSRSSLPSEYIFAVSDTNVAEAVADNLEAYLEEVYKNDNLYTVTAMIEMLDSLNTLISTMSLLIGGIAGISLLVAGVGVMNIMLVSVTERTREIGIRKALGARKRVIMSQFIIEAALTCIIAGVIGIVIGGGLSSFIGSLIGVEAPPTFGAIVVSFSVSVAIGLIFGYMPASRAASLNPIDALRSE